MSETTETPETTNTPIYTFEQTLKDLTVTLPVQKGIRGRDLAIEIKSNSLSVKLKNSPDFLVKGELHKEVVPKNCIWTKDGDVVVIELCKKNQMEWWSCVLKGDPEIDTSKIAPENSSLSDLDPETRAMVEKMQFDQQQRMMGKPTSEELEREKMLEKFKAMHPEMDFSQAKMM